jgi:hypothetical protein
MGMVLITAMGATFTAATGKKASAVAPRLVSNTVAIIQGQTAQINIVNWGDGIVNVEASLLGADGKPLLDTAASIGPGQTFSTHFQWPCCGGGDFRRVELRGLVSLADTSGKTNLDLVVANLEIVDDQSGATALLLPYVLLPAIQPGGGTD